MNKKQDKKLNKKKLKYITLSDAARETGYTPEHLNLLCRKGKLQGEKIGRNWFTKREWLDDFILENKTNNKGGGVRVAKVQEKIKEVVLKKENPGLIEMQKEDLEKTLALSGRIQKSSGYAPKEKSGGRNFAFSFSSLAVVAALAIFFSTGLLDRVYENYGAPAEKIKNKVSGIFSEKENSRKNSLDIKSSDGIKLAEGNLNSKVLGEEIKKITPGIDVLAQVSEPDGEELPEGDYEVRFALYNMDRHEADPYPSDSDQSVWNETQTVHIKSGVMNTRIGISNPMPRVLDPGNNEFYLGVRVGENTEMVPRKKIAVEPLALYAYSAANAQSADTAKNLNGATTGTGAGNIPLISAGGKIDISILPTGTSGKKLVLANDPRLDDETEITIAGSYDYISVSDSELTLEQINLLTDVSGILPVINGGTGNSAIGSAGSVVYSDGTKYDFTLQGVAGQVLLSDGAGKPYWGAVGGAIVPDSIDFMELKDDMTLDNDLTISASASNYSINFDSGTLFLDTANNRVGIGTTAPGQKLSIAGTLGILEGGASPEYYTTLQGGDQSQNVTYTLPTNYPADNGYILTSTTGGVFTWTPPGASTIALGGSIAGGATPGSVLFIDTNSKLAQDGQYFYYNEISHRMGIGNSNPQELFSVGSSSQFQINSSGNVVAGSWNASRIDISGYTNLAVGGTMLQLVGDTLSLKEGTLTDGRLCTYVEGTGLVCTQDPATVGHTAVTLAGQNYLSIDGSQVITAGQIGLGTTNVTGILGLANGGTGIGTTNPGNGTLLIGNGTGYSLANLTAGSGISVSNSSGSITISADTANIIHNSLSGLQGGIASEYYHLTSAQYSALHSAVTLETSAHDYLSLATQQITLGTIDISDDTNLAVGGTFLQRSGDILSLREGTMTVGRLCTFNASGQLECDTSSATVGHTAVTLAGQNYLSIDGSQVITAGQIGLGTTNVTGILGLANGGTGIGTTNPGNGTLLIGNGTGYSLATLTQGSGISITNASGEITIASTLGTSIDISSETNLSVGGTMMQQNGDVISLKEGTLTNGKVCKYVEGTGLVCTTDESALGTNYWQRNGTLVSPLNIGDYVGIGTTSPGQTLSVNGTLGIAGSTAPYYTIFQGGSQSQNITYTLPANYPAGNGYMLTAGTGGVMSWTSPGAASIELGSSIGGGGLPGSVLYIDGAGELAQDNANFFWDYNDHQLGIGTTNPTYSLDIAGTFRVSSTAPVFGSNTIAVPTSGTMALGTGATNQVAYWTGTNTLAGENYLSVSRGGTGIGTTNPANGTLLIGNGTGYSLATLTQGSGISISDASGSITIASTLGDSIDISSETNLSVGGTMLQQSGDSISMKEGTLTNGRICTYVEGTGLVCTTDPGSVGVNYWQRNGALLSPATIGDYVGIGTTSPTTALEVNGIITATGGNSTNWNDAYTYRLTSAGGTAPLHLSLVSNVLSGYIDDATTANKGIASFNSTNFSVSSGAVNTIQNINSTATPTFAGLTLNGQLTSNVVSGTAPFIITSNTLVANLNSDLLDGHDSSYFQVATSNLITGTGATNQVAYWTGTNTLSGENYLSLSRGGTGIGTTNPANGTLLIGNGTGYSLTTLTQGNGISITNASGSITIATTNITSGTGTQNYIPKWDTSGTFANSVIYETGGNVGIGTTNPLQKLSVVGTLGISASNPQYYTIFQGGNQIDNITYTLPAGTGSAGQVLKIDGSGGMYWATVSGGSGGIGTVTSVGSGNGLTGGPITESGTLSISLLGTGITTPTTSSYSGMEFAGASNQLSLIHGCSDDQVLAWNSSSQVWECSTVSGIGGITGSGSSGYITKWNGTNTLTISSLFENATGVGIGNTNPTGVFQIGIGNTTPLFVSTGGYVGIGTTNPTNGKLEVNGTVYASAFSDDGAAVSADTAQAYLSSALTTGLVKVTNGTGALTTITDNSGNWNDAYTYRLTSAGGTAPLHLSIVGNTLSG
ncbi:MAG TPA: helix-turn-helix domain-containing protein, partial [Candidatus Moranbacteria bacterium]|nr:helix-turn-helix domain-containing protein [Candidatus Moranbacteria bacterium]